MTSGEGAQPSASELAARLEAGRSALAEAIEGLDEEGFRRRALSGEWTAAEVLAHLLANEQRLVEIAELALTQDRPQVQSRGEAQREEEAKSARRMLVPQIWHGLLAQRRETLQRLQALSAAELARTAVHSRFGEVSVAWIMQRLADHEHEHAAQIRAVRAGTASAT
jgi:hypothetical protein